MNILVCTQLLAYSVFALSYFHTSIEHFYCYMNFFVLILKGSIKSHIFCQILILAMFLQEHGFCVCWTVNEPVQKVSTTCTKFTFEMKADAHIFHCHFMKWSG